MAYGQAFRLRIPGTAVQNRRRRCSPGRWVPPRCRRIEGSSASRAFGLLHAAAVGALDTVQYLNLVTHGDIRRNSFLTRFFRCPVFPPGDCGHPRRHPRVDGAAGAGEEAEDGVYSERRLSSRHSALTIVSLTRKINNDEVNCSGK